MPTTLGDVSVKERRAVVRDLLNFNLSVEDITEKHEIGVKVVYQIANRAHLDMMTRSRIMRIKAKQRELARIIQMEIDHLKSKVEVK
jgi:transposase